MSEQVPTRSPSPETAGNGWAVGFALFAAVMMIIIGIFQAISGLAAILENHFYLAVGDYVFGFNVAAWGWIHLLIGVLVAVAGVFVYTGTLWARTAGIVMAAVSAIENFMFMPYYPMWSLLVIVLDVLVIWALAVHGFRTAHTFSRHGH